MFYGRKQFAFTFIGAGSSVFTMRLVGDILKEDFIEGGEIRLVDIDVPVLEEVTAAVQKLVAHSGKPLRVMAFDHYKNAFRVFYLRGGQI